MFISDSELVVSGFRIRNLSFFIGYLSFLIGYLSFFFFSMFIIVYLSFSITYLSFSVKFLTLDLSFLRRAPGKPFLMMIILYVKDNYKEQNKSPDCVLLDIIPHCPKK